MVMVDDNTCQSLLTDKGDNPAMSTFADRLAGAMRAANIESNAELARRAGCTRQAISKWLKGSPFNEADTLFAIARELRVSARWLLLNEGLPSQKHDLSDDEIALVTQFREMSDAQRASLLALVAAMSK